MTKLKRKPFALIGVHVGGSDADKLKKLMAKQKLHWRTFVDNGPATRGGIASRWNLSSTPTFYIIDHEGIIRQKWVGSPDAKAVDAALETLIQKAKAAKPK